MQENRAKWAEWVHSEVAERGTMKPDIMPILAYHRNKNSALSGQLGRSRIVFLNDAAS